MASASKLYLLVSLMACSVLLASAGNFYRDMDITWGDGRGKILNNGQLLTLSLDKPSGSGFQSKNEYLFGKIDMQIKLVRGNSAGTVTAYYVLQTSHSDAPSHDCGCSKIFKKDIGQAAGLIRLHFHDCFVQGCDGSVLLDGSASGPSEKNAPPNLSLRPQAFKIINDLRSRIHKACGRVVSCADITALAARDAVLLSGGPNYPVPLGRRDGLAFATQAATLQNFPPPFANTSALITALAAKKLDTTDLVALSGAHTIGIGNCGSFTSRLYSTQDSTMDKTFAKNLKVTCPKSDTSNTTVLDIRSPNVFDNKYYVDLMNRQGLFTSDQDLYMDARTKPIVTSFAVDQTVFREVRVLDDQDGSVKCADWQPRTDSHQLFCS